MKHTQMLITIHGPKSHYFAECNFDRFWSLDDWKIISGDTKDENLTCLFRHVLHEAKMRLATLIASNALQDVLADLSADADMFGESSYSLYDAVGQDGLTLSSTITTFHD